MKVLLINGSPHQFGCTYTALNEISKTLKQEGIDSEIYYIGVEPISSCRACYACAEVAHCVVDDKVNEFSDYAREFDGYIIGSPVHYAGASTILTTFLNRVFFSDSKSGIKSFAHKPGAAIVSARRAGTTAALDQLNKYFQIQQMPIISGRYWNMVHGSTPEDVLKDEEGMQNMRVLAKNFAYHLKCKEIAQNAGIFPPEHEPITRTNFIR